MASEVYFIQRGKVNGFPELMIGASSVQKTAMLCFVAGKFMMPLTVFARFFIGEQAGYACLGIYTGLIVACIVICMYDRYYHVPFVEENEIKLLEKKLIKLKRQKKELKDK